MNGADFLAHIFAGCNGIPVTATKSDGYNSRRWCLRQPVPLGVTYFCISTVRDVPRSRVLGRKTEDLVATYVIVLDDVGTKVSRETIKLTPSYVLESSAGNFQYGYVLAEGIEPARAAALIEALAAAGLTDPGAKRADRIMRVPGSLNDKYSPPFAARLAAWNPEIDYTLSELCVGFGVTPTDVVDLKVNTALAEGEADPVLDWLQAHGHVLGGPNPRGWYPVRCPQEDQHTGDVDHGTDYMPGAPGAFVCLHGHCAGFKTANLRSWILSQDPAAEVGVLDRAAITSVGQRLGAALGLDIRAVGPSRETGTDREEGVLSRSTADDTLQRLNDALQAAAGPGSIFHRPDAAAASLSLVQRLAAAIGGIFLDPSLLPDADTLPNGNAARTQAVTSPRVHHVMNLIGMTARQNVLTGGIECKFSSFEGYNPADDTSEGAVEVLVHACVRCGMRGAEAVRYALLNYASERKYSPVSEWILSAQWDGVSRFPALFNTVKMRDPIREEWKRVAMGRWMIQTIAAIRNWEPGRVPTSISAVLVLQGDQGARKSFWAQSLMPSPWVTIGVSLKLDHGERDAVKRVTATPITELGEVDGSFKRSDTASLKNFLSAPVDIYRPPYGRVEVARPRGTSFLASVNPEGYLLDQTGERRFWTLAVESCNDAHGIDLQQLWAEAWAIAATGERFWLEGGEIEMHAAASNVHHAATDVTFILEDLAMRREAFFDQKLWVHTNARDLVRHYGIKGLPSVYQDLSEALRRAEYRSAVVKGKRGFYVPPFEQSLTAAQVAAFKVIVGGAVDNDKKP